MLPSTPLNDRIGFALTRIIVPLWIFLGVYFKMEAGTAANLPSNIRTFFRPWGPEVMDAVLYTLIGLEIFAILVMLFIARLARPMAIFMLAAFCIILIGEMAKGADKCGCFGGTINVEPWQMLVADGILLLGVILFRPPHKSTPHMEPTPGLTSDAPGGRKTRMLTLGTIAASTLALLAGLATSFILGNLLHGGESKTPAPSDGDTVLADPSDPYQNPAIVIPPRNWYPQNLPAWIGRPWREIQIFQFMPRWPEGLDDGVHYIVFYSRTCSHCDTMFHEDFTRPLGAPVIAIQIPASRTELTGASSAVWPMPDDLHPDVTLVNLPLGPDWSLVTPPLAMRIEDGIVACANEGDHKECFEIE